MALRIVVLGAGHWHGAFDAAYLRLFARMPAVEVVGVHDDDPAVAADPAGIIGAIAYTDARQMIETEQPDFALSLGTHETMPSLHRLCLDYRLPFMTEKPMGRHADEVRPVVERIEREGLYVAVALPNRLGPIYAHAKAMLCGGRFRHTGISTLPHHPPHAQPLSRIRQSLDARPGHQPAVAASVTSDRIRSMFFSASPARRRRSRRPPSASAGTVPLSRTTPPSRSVTSSGIVGTLETGYTYPTEGTDMELRIAGSDAILRFDRGRRDHRPRDG